MEKNSKPYDGYCRSCYKNISKEEYDKYNNYCKECYENVDEIIEDDDSDDKASYMRKNPIASVIKYIAILGAIIGILFGCSQLDSYEETLGIIYIVVSVISAIFIYALGEIIQLLEDIKNKD